MPPPRDQEALFGLYLNRDREETLLAYNVLLAIRDAFSATLGVDYFTAILDDPDEARAMHNLHCNRVRSRWHSRRPAEGILGAGRSIQARPGLAGLAALRPQRSAGPRGMAGRGNGRPKLGLFHAGRGREVGPGCRGGSPRKPMPGGNALPQAPGHLMGIAEHVGGKVIAGLPPETRNARDMTAMLAGNRGTQQYSGTSSTAPKGFTIPSMSSGESASGAPTGSRSKPFSVELSTEAATNLAKHIGEAVNNKQDERPWWKKLSDTFRGGAQRGHEQTEGALNKYDPLSRVRNWAGGKLKGLLGGKTPAEETAAADQPLPNTVMELARSNQARLRGSLLQDVEKFPPGDSKGWSQIIKPPPMPGQMAAAAGEAPPIAGEAAAGSSQAAVGSAAAEGVGALEGEGLLRR